MLANAVLSVLSGVTSLLVIPLQLVTTLVLGVLASITFGLLMIPFDLLWIVLFLGPILASSWICSKVPVLREPIGFIGIVWLLLANAYVCLLPTMGELDARLAKLALCEAWPYSWEYWQYDRGRLPLPSPGSKALGQVVRRMCSNPLMKKYLSQRGESLDVSFSLE